MSRLRSWVENDRYIQLKIYQNLEEELFLNQKFLALFQEKLYEYDQGDKPDYLAYHLEEDFDTWNEGQKQRCSFKEIQDLALVSDGIFSFKLFDNQSYMELKEDALVDSLLLQIPEGKEGYYYKKEMLKIEKDFGLKPGDDFSIIHLLL